MKLPSLVFLLLLAGAVAVAAEDPISHTGHYNEQEADVAESLIPSIIRASQAKETDLQWILLLPPHIRSYLINKLPDLHDEASPRGTACDRALMLFLKNDPVPNFRSRAASGLNPNRSNATRNALVEALKDTDPHVRLFACQSLMICEDHSVSKAVMPMLDDSSHMVRYVAARTLGCLGAKDALPALRTLYKNTKPEAGEAANLAEAFSRLGDEAMTLKATPPLLTSDNWNIRHHALNSLKLVKSKQAVALLINTLYTEMQHELHENRIHHFRLPTRTMNAICGQLDSRTEQTIGVDPKAWMTWWAGHSAEYGVPASEALPRDGFDDLCARYMLVIKKGFEPGLPELLSCRLTLSKGDGTIQQGDSGWSEVVNGVRLRLLAPPEIRINTTSRVNILVQNMTGKPISMPILALAPAIDIKDDPSRDCMRTNDLKPWRLQPEGTVLISVTIVPFSEKKMIRTRTESLSPAYVVNVETRLPESLVEGHYKLVFALDSARQAELQQTTMTSSRGPSWEGSLVSPPVKINFIRASGRDNQKPKTDQ